MDGSIGTVSTYQSPKMVKKVIKAFANFRLVKTITSGEPEKMARELEKWESEKKEFLAQIVADLGSFDVLKNFKEDLAHRVLLEVLIEENYPLWVEFRQTKLRELLPQDYSAFMVTRRDCR